MDNKIKLIFGQNDEGKSLYYRNKTDDPLCIALNYDVEKIDIKKYRIRMVK